MAGQQQHIPGNHAHIETRLLVVAEMLERAVAEVHRAMAEIKAGDGPAYGSDPEGSERDVSQ